MRIDDGTDRLWGGSDHGFDVGAEAAALAADDRTARGVEDPAGAPKIEWGVEEGRGGVASGSDGSSSSDAAPATAGDGGS
jgi:hypothetical protein